MSAKWRRSQAWDDAHLTGPLTPLRWVLRLFSGIPLAVVLLTIVSLYGAIASVPIGLLVLGLTYAVYGVTVLAAIGVLLVPGVLIARRLTTGGTRFVSVVGVIIGSVVVGVGAWYAFAWPAMHFDPVTGSGLKLFPEFVAQYRSVTVRRLPGMEMTELEFYSWWPLRVVLLLFVVNMVTATVRRIEFSFKNLGVLTVHSGIVVIALGSVYYQGLKKEGDTILLAGPRGADGIPGVGGPQRAFFDNVRTALYVNQFRGWQQRPIPGLPRYNDYALGVAPEETAIEAAALPTPWDDAVQQDSLSISLPTPPTSGPAPLIDEDLRFRVVGYAQYAEPVSDWARMPGPPPSPGATPRPLRVVSLLSRVPDEDGEVSTDPVFAFTLLPTLPQHRVSDNDVLGVEYLVDADGTRWEDLGSRVPNGAPHGLVVELPATADRDAVRMIAPIGEGQSFPVGNTGYNIRVKQLLPEPPFPIVTEGYQGATSSVAVIEVRAPAEGDKPAEVFDRWVYSRFPEISQDLLQGEALADGRPSRRDADPRIRLAYLDDAHINVFFNERSDTGATDVIVRGMRGTVTQGKLGDDDTVRDAIPQIDFRIDERWAHAERFERPIPVPEPDRENRFIGTHDRAMMALEITGGGREDAPAFGKLVWLPFTKYLGVSDDLTRRVTLPDGRVLDLAFGRMQHRFGGFQLRMAGFEMISYDHRGAPRDYRSVIAVEPTGAEGFEPFAHEVKLNAPLTAPFNIHDSERSPIATLAGRLGTGLDPNQYKLSQAGWDAAGWEQTQAMADRGEIERPYAQFTILGVGNNPGIHVIAFGGVMIALGIPWAFYLKPWLVKREKARLQREVEAKREAGSEAEQRAAPPSEGQPVAAGAEA
ncbi:MAG: hypothetical protein AAGG07_11010 [Planctomycetota bacterium]